MGLGGGFLKFLGKTIVVFALSLFLFSYFLESSSLHAEELHESLKDSVTLDLVLKLSDQEMSEQELEAMQKNCDNNPQEESCIVFNDPSSLLDSQEFTKVLDKIKDYGRMKFGVILISAVLFLFGFFLYFVGDRKFGDALYRVSLASAFSCGFAALYYNLLPIIIKSGFFRSFLPDYEDQSLVMMFANVIADWFKIVIKEVTTVAIIATVIFAIIAVISYFVSKE